jgi:DNA modification methylase
VTIRILEGHILEVLSREPAGSVHCAVTSPPYLWLRAYGTEPQVWDGAEGCEHEWGAMGKSGTRLRNGQGTATPGFAGGKGDPVLLNPPTGAFCARCGAWRGELGQEPSPELYVQHLVAVMEAVKRVLRDDGSLWVNIAGCFFNDPGGQNGSQGTVSAKAVAANAQQGRQQRGRHPWLKALDWVDVPGLFAHAMQAAGWLWRSDVVWVKPSALPESVSGTAYVRHRIKLTGEAAGAYRRMCEAGLDAKQAMHHARIISAEHITEERKAKRDYETEWVDCPLCAVCQGAEGYVLRRGNGRPTKSSERVLVFAKKPGYYWDAEAVREPNTPGAIERFAGSPDSPPRHKYRGWDGKSGGAALAYGTEWRGNGHSLRDVWTIGPEPLKDEHYAAFPTTLPTRCIKAGTSERGCCPGCGAPWARLVGETQAWAQQRATLAAVRDDQSEDWVAGRGNRAFSNTSGVTAERETLGWRPTCRCVATAPDLAALGMPDPPVPCRVLDPFAGSGTTLIAADRLGRDAVGVELKSQYVAMAQRRITQDAPLLLWGAVTVEADTTRSAPEAVPLLLESLPRARREEPESLPRAERRDAVAGG